MTDLEFKQQEFEHKKYLDTERLRIDKIDLLSDLLSASNVDRDQSGFSETRHTPIINEENANIIQNKIMKLLREL